MQAEINSFNTKEFVGRALELEWMSDFLQEDGSGFLHIRGRRRIGKSWYLKKVMVENKNCFYFQGREDASNRFQMADFAKQWDLFTGKKRLGIIKQSELSWEEMFKEIHDHAIGLNSTVVLIFDEIQWISKKRVGFVSKLKEAWSFWEGARLIKVIISGSSNKFFEDEKSEDTKILRGLRTFSDINIGPFTLKELQQYFFKKWTEEEVCLTYMITGGVPYYVRRLNSGKSFIRSVNDAFFTRSSIFLDELEEILGLEFNRKSRENVKRVLGTLGQDGKTIANICKKVTVHEKTVRDILEKLIDYKIVFEKAKEGEPPKATKVGVKYIMNDCFLNFYFQVLEKYEKQVRRNKTENIFGEKILASNGFYIKDFTGKAFELLIQLVLEDCRKKACMNGIIKKMGLKDFEFEISYYWEEGKTEVDRIIFAPGVREAKILEAKWTSNKADKKKGFVEQVLDKAYTPPNRFSLEHYLAISGGWTKPLEEQAKEEGVSLIELKDLF